MARYPYRSVSGRSHDDDEGLSNQSEGSLTGGKLWVAQKKKPNRFPRAKKAMELRVSIARLLCQPKSLLYTKSYPSTPRQV